MMNKVTKSILVYFLVTTCKSISNKLLLQLTIKKNKNEFYYNYFLLVIGRD